MSKHSCTYYERTVGFIDWTFELDPADYLDFETEEEVEDEILNVDCSADSGDYEMDECEEVNLDIPDSFWEEWRKLKGYE